MSRELVILWAGRRERGGVEELCRDYRARIERFTAVREVVVKARGGSDDPGRLREEGRALLAALPEPCFTVALDVRGRALSSEELAEWLARLRENWPHPIAFLVGSDLGLADEALAAARFRLSFGPITLPHELARLVLLEQLYRALSIAAGINYHRA